jgi:PAS domain S-box-containing protein
MFGYGPGELAGVPLESLVPTGLREAQRGHRGTCAREPTARPTGMGAQLAGVRKDGTTFPVRVSLTPVTAGSGQLTLAVVRDITAAGRLDDLVSLARDAAASRQEHLRLLDAVITGLFHAGLGLQGAGTQRTDAVLSELDDIIGQIGGAALAGRAQPASAPRLGDAG